MKRLVRPLVVMLAFLAVAVVAAGVDAQPPRRGPGGRGAGMRGAPGGGPLDLLRSETVRQELKLTAEQEAKLREIAEEVTGQMRDRMSGLRDLSEDERRARFQQFREEARKRAEELQAKIKEVLSPGQLERLKQIQLQQEGIRALARPEVAEALALTAEQTEQLRAIAQELRQKQEEAFSAMRGLRELEPEVREKKVAELREKGRQIREAAETKAMAVLTDAQKAKLTELLGDPVELERPRFGGGRPGGGEGRRPRRERPET